MYETVLGAEEVSANIAVKLKENSGVVFSTACPVFVEYVKKYVVELLPAFTPFFHMSFLIAKFSIVFMGMISE